MFFVPLLHTYRAEYPTMLESKPLVPNRLQAGTGADRFGNSS